MPAVGGAAPFSDLSSAEHTTTYVGALSVTREYVCVATLWLPKVTIAHAKNAIMSAKTKPSTNNLTTMRRRR